MTPDAIPEALRREALQSALDAVDAVLRAADVHLDYPARCELLEAELDAFADRWTAALEAAAPPLN